MCAGDFNDIFYNYKKEWGKVKVVRKIKGFRQKIDNCCLIDLKFQGEKLTWINKREDGFIKERIDKAMVNLRWLEKFPRMQVFNLHIVGSDHA